MAELPEDCLLIPNHFNGVPDFTFYDHHFFPGFPQMAWPMLDWVLEMYYPRVDEKIRECPVHIRDTQESSLYELMESLSLRYTEV